MNRIQEFIPQLTAVRLVGMVMIAIATYLGGNFFHVFQNTKWNFNAIGEMAYSLMQFGYLDQGDYEAGYGSTVMTFYVLIAMATFVSYLCLKSKSRLAIKTGFGMAMSMVIVVTLSTVFESVQGNAGGWYEHFWLATISPLVFIFMVRTTFRLFWRMTAQTEDPGAIGVTN